MRIASANTMKRRKKGARCQEMPTEGSVSRALWDKLQANKGTFVDMNELVPKGRYAPILLSNIRRDLTDFWGLDIAYKPKGIWCLVGE